MAISPVTLAQSKFLMNGGAYELALARKRETGELPSEHIHREYPKAIRFDRGVKVVDRETDTCKGTVIKWTETVKLFEDIIVNSEEEEERVLAGGKTSSQIEEDRQGLFGRCHAMGIPADPSWSAVRLRRELGDALDAPPGDEMGALKMKLAHLEEIAALKAKIAALEANARASEATEPPIEELGDKPRRKAA